MRIFAAPLIIFSPQVNLTMVLAVSPRQAARQLKVSSFVYTMHAATALAA
jgi:hypothetical protein